MKTYIGAAIIALIAAQPVLALEYDPYNEQGRIAREQADASNPQIIALRNRAMKEYWHCVAIPNMALAEAQKILGPICSQTWEGWFNTQVSVYHLDHQQ